MAEYGRIHTDGSRSGGQPTQSDCEVAASIRSALYRACSNMPNYPKGIVEPFVAAHHRHGYDQGYYDGCARQPTQSDAPLDAEGVKLYWYRQGKDDGVEHERAKIVAWLREQDGHGYDAMRADCIEAGEHLK